MEIEKVTLRNTEQFRHPIGCGDKPSVIISEVELLNAMLLYILVLQQGLRPQKKIEEIK